jgi:hypothetical protein
MGFIVLPVGPDPWDGFADHVDRNDGILGGCRCIGFHLDRAERAVDPREAKHERVHTDAALVALVVDDDGGA